MNVANARTLAPGLSVRFLSARYPDHCSARFRLEANLDDVASGYACLCGLGQLGNCVSFYMIPSVERQREWIMHRIGQREWIMHSMYALVGVGLRSHRAAQGRRQNRQLFRIADEDCPVRSGGADTRGPPIAASALLDRAEDGGAQKAWQPGKGWLLRGIEHSLRVGQRQQRIPGDAR